MYVLLTLLKSPGSEKIQLVQKSLAIGLSHLLSSERGSLAWGRLGSDTFLKKLEKKKSHLALSGMDESEFWGVFKLT